MFFDFQAMPAQVAGIDCTTRHQIRKPHSPHSQNTEATGKRLHFALKPHPKPSTLDYLGTWESKPTLKPSINDPFRVLRQQHQQLLGDVPLFPGIRSECAH